MRQTIRRTLEKGYVNSPNQGNWAAQGHSQASNTLAGARPDPNDITQRLSALPLAVVKGHHVVLAVRGGVLGKHLALLSGSDLQGQRCAPT